MNLLVFSSYIVDEEILEMDLVYGPLFGSFEHDNEH
jgi:hypothetical protein